MKKVKVPFFFYVDMQEEGVTERLKASFLKWLNQVTKDNPNTSYSPTYFNGGHRFIGFDNRKNYVNSYANVMSTDYVSKYEGCERVTLKFWEDNIKNAKYKAIIRERVTETATGNGHIPWALVNTYNIKMVELGRNQIVRMTDPNTNVSKALKAIGEKVTKDVFIAISSSLALESYGYTLLGEQTTGVDGTSYPDRCLRGLIKNGELFQCEYTGYYSKAKHLVEALNVNGELIKVSEYHCNPITSSRDDVAFTDQVAATANGYGWCNREEDYRPIGEIYTDPNAVYHHTVRDHGHQWMCPKNTKFTIGFEIEKEDEEAKQIHHKQLFKRTKWIKESDGSLDDEAGYELVSPVFDLMSSKLDQVIEKDEQIKRLINGSVNIQMRSDDNGNEAPYESCGGHINLGSSIYTPIQMFYGLKGFLPLLYSIFNMRVNKQYSKANKSHAYVAQMGSNNHSSALQIKDKVLELRIVAAVRNVKNLLWRRDLMRIMVANINKSESEVLRMMLNERSLLHQHLRKVYKSSERYMKKCNDFVKFSDLYNDIALEDVNWDRFVDKNTVVEGDVEEG